MFVIMWEKIADFCSLFWGQKYEKLPLSCHCGSDVPNMLVPRVLVSISSPYAHGVAFDFIHHFLPLVGTVSQSALDGILMRWSGSYAPPLRRAHSHDFYQRPHLLCRSPSKQANRLLNKNPKRDYSENMEQTDYKGGHIFQGQSFQVMRPNLIKVETPVKYRVLYHLITFQSTVQ